VCFQEVVEEPATDRDSDHTDSEATVDRKNTCELATRCYCFRRRLVLWLLPNSPLYMQY
jgi:hypothetical protein